MLNRLGPPKVLLSMRICHLYVTVFRSSVTCVMHNDGLRNSILRFKTEPEVSFDYKLWLCKGIAYVQREEMHHDE